MTRKGLRGKIGEVKHRSGTGVFSMATQSNMENIRHFIWDFDGTLFDTYPMIVGNLRKALNEFGCDCDFTEAMRLMLVNSDNAIRYYAGQFAIDQEALLHVYYRYRSQCVGTFTAEPMEGVKEVLKRICATGRYNYIFTHRKDDETARYLENYGLDKYFREIVGADSPHFAWKPAPDAVLYFMDKYAMQPEDTVMIGDRECDLSSGRNAGVGAVHYVCSAVPENLDCRWRVERFADMLALL